MNKVTKFDTATIIHCKCGRLIRVEKIGIELNAMEIKAICKCGKKIYHKSVSKKAKSDAKKNDKTEDKSKKIKDSKKEGKEKDPKKKDKEDEVLRNTPPKSEDQILPVESTGVTA